MHLFSRSGRMGKRQIYEGWGAWEGEKDIKEKNLIQE